MPFVAECILCRQKVRLPDRSVGASVECPRCHSFFTAAPTHDVPPPAKRPEPQRAPVPVATAVAAAQPQQPATAPTELPAQTSETSGDLAPDVTPLVPRLVMPALPPRRSASPRGIDPVGLGAIVVCAAALVCVWFYALCFLVIPLALFGLLTALVALAVGLLADRPRYVLATIGCAANALVIGSALFYPRLLGPTYEMSRVRGEVEAVVARAVPLAGTKLVAGEEYAEWPDASRFAVQIRKVRIQVVGATVRPLEIAQTPKKKYSKESYLVLRVRIHQPAGGAEFASDAWGQEGTAQERHQPVVTDASGTVYRAATNIGGEAGEMTQHARDFPLGITDDIFLFDAPPPSVTYLHLEMPAASWGGTGSVRFTIPRAMMQFELPKTGKEKS